jgi:uncharacterized protein with HEPN domain
VRGAAHRLRDMLEALERIAQRTGSGREAFASDELIQTWVVHHLLILGEAAARLGRDFHAAHPSIPWARMVGMRNILVHEYFGLDLDAVWMVVEAELPRLRDALSVLLAELEAGGGPG